MDMGKKSTIKQPFSTIHKSKTQKLSSIAVNRPTNGFEYIMNKIKTKNTQQSAFIDCEM